MVSKGDNDYGKRFCKEKGQEMVLPLLCGGCQWTGKPVNTGKFEKNYD